MFEHRGARRIPRVLITTALVATCLGLTAAPAAQAKGAVAAHTTLYRGQIAGQAVTLERDDLRFHGPGGAPSDFSFRRAWLRQLGEPSGDGEQHDIRWNLLSAVGPLVSVETHGEGYVTGTAHPYAYGTITAYDARRGGKPAVLTDYFASRDILTALLADGLVRKALGSQPAAARPRTLAALQAALAGYQSEDCVYAFGPDLLSSFAFHHVAGDRVAVRFGLSHGCEVARGRLTILAIYLPIPTALRADLAAARTGRAGFLVPAAPKGTAHASLTRGKGLPR